METLICRNLDAALRNEPKPYAFDATAGASASQSVSKTSTTVLLLAGGTSVLSMVVLGQIVICIQQSGGPLGVLSASQSLRCVCHTPTDSHPTT